MNDIAVLWTPNNATGLLPRDVPTTPAELGATHHPGWHALGQIAHSLGSTADRDLEEFVASLDLGEELEQLSATQNEALLRALTMVATHLIHRPYFAPRKSLPKQLAWPLWRVAANSQRSPTLTYASYVLANFTSPIRGRTSPEDLKIAQTPTGTADEEWFVAVHLSVESASGDVVAALAEIEDSLESSDTSRLVKAFEAVESCVRYAMRVMPMVRERLDRGIFVRDVRPFLYGYQNVSFQGIDGNPLVSYVGETGAQSGVIRAIDAVLGTRHSPSVEATMENFLACAPPTHQTFFKNAARVGRQLDVVQQRAVRDARRSALVALSEFRRSHLNVVQYYLVSSAKPPVKKGTGGTKFGSWLQQMVDETDRTVAEL